MRPDRELRDEQIAYYRARASEYDITTTPTGDPFAPHGDATRTALRAFEPAGEVLELAAGTGQWTPILAEYATSLTAVDSSQEMLDINRAKLGRWSTRYMVADFFAWKPPQDYYVVFFGFFLSHVPLSHFDMFWSLVARSLRADGRVFSSTRPTTASGTRSGSIVIAALSSARSPMAASIERSRCYGGRRTCVIGLRS